MIKRIGLTFLLSTALALPAAAQGRSDQDKVPKGFRPPPGMCRIWLDNVPPGQQPAPTDCATAVRNRPPNGRVIFGDDYAEPKRLKPADRSRPDDDRDDDRSDVRREDRRDDDKNADRRDEAQRGSDDAKGRVDSARKRRRPNG
jgi:hypothetical protein